MRSMRDGTQVDPLQVWWLVLTLARYACRLNSCSTSAIALSKTSVGAVVKNVAG